MSELSYYKKNREEKDDKADDKLHIYLMETKDFEQALIEYIDESKPDPLLRRKLTSLCLEWKNSDPAKDTIEKSEDKMSHDGHKNVICGVLTLHGEYMSVSLHAHCFWDIFRDNHGFLSTKMDFELLIVDSKFKTFSQSKKVCSKTSVQSLNKKPETQNLCDSQMNQDDEKKVDKNEKKTSSRVDKKIQKKLMDGMRKRLQSDFYIKKIINLNNSTSKNQHRSEIPDKLILCHASIHQSVGKTSYMDSQVIPSLKGDKFNSAETLEERVDVSENTVKGIQRIFFACDDDETDAYLTVMEFLLSMPYLPQKSALKRNETLSQISHSTSQQVEALSEQSDAGMLNKIKTDSLKDLVPSIAERVYLRLLEDAMLDACEMEGNDDILDDLKISKYKANKKARDND